MNIKNRLQKLEETIQSKPKPKTCDCPEVIVLKPGDVMPTRCGDCKEVIVVTIIEPNNEF